MSSGMVGNPSPSSRYMFCGEGRLTGYACTHGSAHKGWGAGAAVHADMRHRTCMHSGQGTHK